MNYYEMLLARKLAKGELPPNAYLLKTASGSFVSFSDGANLPMPSFVCNIDAVQDLHGYDAPWVGGAGKNKLPNPMAETKTVGNLTVSIDSLGTITVSGSTSATTTILFDLPSNFVIPISVSAGGNGCLYLFNTSVNNNIVFMLYNNDNLVDTWVCNEVNRKSSSYIAMGGITINKIGIRVQGAITISGSFKLSPMFTNDGTTDATFAPYSNICPISGHTGLDAWVRGKNVLPNEITNATEGGITFSTQPNGKIKISGTSTKNLYETDICENFSLPLGQYILSYDAVDGVNVQICNRAEDREYCAVRASAPSVTFTVDETKQNDMKVRFTIGSGVTVNGETGVMIRLADQDATYEPYNPNSQTIQVSWQTEAGEVFGGYVDLVSGVLTVTHKSQTGFTRGSQDSSNKLYNIGTISDIKAYTNASVISPYFIDSMFEKLSVQGARTAETPSITHYNKALYVGGYIGKEAELDTLLESLQVKYELETPITYQLTPTQIKSLLGNNNAWCDTGDVDIEYFGKGAE